MFVDSVFALLFFIVLFSVLYCSRDKQVKRNPNTTYFVCRNLLKNSNLLTVVEDVIRLKDDDLFKCIIKCSFLEKKMDIICHLFSNEDKYYSTLALECLSDYELTSTMYMLYKKDFVSSDRLSTTCIKLRARFLTYEIMSLSFKGDLTVRDLKRVEKNYKYNTWKEAMDTALLFCKYYNHEEIVDKILFYSTKIQSYKYTRRTGLLSLMYMLDEKIDINKLNEVSDSLEGK